MNKDSAVNWPIRTFQSNREKNMSFRLALLHFFSPRFPLFRLFQTSDGARLATPKRRAREDCSQTEKIGSVSKQLLPGRQVPWLHPNHHNLLSCADHCSMRKVCYPLFLVLNSSSAAIWHSADPLVGRPRFLKAAHLEERLIRIYDSAGINVSIENLSCDSLL